MNITRDYHEPAQAAARLEIQEVLCLESGTFLDVRSYIKNQTYSSMIERQMEVRSGLKKGSFHFTCPMCSVPVYISTNTNKRFFFKHKVEDGSCPAVTHGSLTKKQMDARKYLGARESKPHIDSKNRIIRSLEADPDFSDIAVEQRIKSQNLANQWRQPDVRAEFRGQIVAFEVQLSTTFLDVVLDRQDFYTEQGILLVWILPYFAPRDRRLTDDRVFIRNNRNVLIVDNETTRLSEEGQKFLVRVCYQHSEAQGDHVKDVWDEQIVPFSALNIDLDRQQAFFFDYEKSVKAANAAVQCVLQEAREQEENAARNSFLNNWEVLNAHDYYGSDERRFCTSIKEKVLNLGYRLPDCIAGDGSFKVSVSNILSIKNWKPTGFGYHKVKQVAHHAFDRYKPSLIYLASALETYGKFDALREEDTSEKWKPKARIIAQAYQSQEGTFMPDIRYLDTILFLFPDIEAAVKRRIAKFDALAYLLD